MLATIQIKTLGPHKYGCLMAPLPSVLAADLLAWTRANVPEQHLGPGGIETTPHVTVKYGFKDAGPDHDARLRQVVRDFGAFPITLGPASLFTGGDDGDVLKLDVESDRLRELNKLVSFLFACEDKYPDYQPHVTLAYLDPKVSAPYASAGVPFTGRQVKFDRLLYSTAEGAEQFLPLGWLGSKRLEMQTKGWVTMGGKPCGDGGGQHCGGTAVELGGDGEIKKGPKGTVGKKPAELPKKDSKPKATAPAPAPKKEKPAQPAPAKKDGGGEVSGAVHDLLKTMNGTPEQINAGGCWTFAYKLVNKVGRGELRGNGIHGWAEIDGKHYDAEAPEGVDDPRDLAFFKRDPSMWNGDTNDVDQMYRDKLTAKPAATPPDDSQWGQKGSPQYKVYAALAANPGKTADEIAKASGVDIAGMLLGWGVDSGKIIKEGDKYRLAAGGAKPPPAPPTLPPSKISKPAAPPTPAADPDDVVNLATVGPAVKAAIKELDEVAKSWKKEINSIQRKSLENYTAFSDNLNLHMKNCPPHFDCLPDEAKAELKNVEAAIAKFPKLAKPTPVYRGVRVDKDTANALVARMKSLAGSGETFTMPSLTSTSVDPEVAISFSKGKADKVPLVFQVLANHGAYLEDLTEHSDEFELLLSGQAKYKPVKVAMADYGKHGMHRTIFLEQV